MKDNFVIKYLPANEQGQDYICGDLHGHRQLLMKKLDELGFDYGKDRLFCTGDLNDRGPNSFGTLMLVHEPWFHFVAGNHEADLPKFLEQEYHTHPAYCDQAWTYDLAPDQLEYLRTDILPALSAAPKVLRVGTEFWVVHADRCEARGYSNPAILLDDEHLPLASDPVQQESFLWSRRLFNQIPNNLENRVDFLVAPGQEMETGVGLTFVGHNIVEKPVLFRSHFFIDTGVYMPDGYLTVLKMKEVLSSIEQTS